jgi:hypothetical protein
MGANARYQPTVTFLEEFIVKDAPCLKMTDQAWFVGEDPAPFGTQTNQA